MRYAITIHRKGKEYWLCVLDNEEEAIKYCADQNWIEIDKNGCVWELGVEPYDSCIEG